jgi:hypothetical protein
LNSTEAVPLLGDSYVSGPKGEIKKSLFRYDPRGDMIPDLWERGKIYNHMAIL